jgi:hypothetical protein
MMSSVETKDRKTIFPNCVLVGGIVLIASAVVITNSATAAPAQQRPIEDFVEAQGTYCLTFVCDEVPPCFLFVPPVENFLGWTDPPDCEGVSVDYAGLADAWITGEGGDSFGTEFSGSVTERPLQDGRTLVKVVLHTTNALVWAFEDCDFDFGGAPTIFGHRAPAVLDGASAVLGRSLLRVTFITSAAPGDDLPDLLQVAFCPEAGQEITFLSFVATASGEFTEASDFPDGTPADLQTTQTGLFGTSFFPVEIINIVPVDG